MKPGWRKVRIGEILELIYGKPLEQGARDPNGKYPVYGANGEIARTDKYYHDKASIIVGRKGSAGELKLSEENFWPLDVTYFVTFNEELYDLRFLYFLLKTLDLPKLAKGVKPGINRNEVYSIEVMVPPLPEQQRIVRILDEAFAGIAVARANAEKNLQNAREVFDAYMEQIFSHCSEEWNEASQLVDLTEPESPITYGVVKPGKEGDVVFVRGGDLNRGRVLINQLRTITKDVSEQYKRTLLHGGELLISLVGQPGQVSVAPNELCGANIARQVGLIRLRQTIDANFVCLYLRSPVGQRALGKRQSGSVQQVINLSELRQVQVPLPPLLIQRKIVEEIETVEKETFTLESIFSKKSLLLDELKQSMLNHAFTGQL